MTIIPPALLPSDSRPSEKVESVLSFEETNKARSKKGRKTKSSATSSDVPLAFDLGDKRACALHVASSGDSWRSGEYVFAEE